MQTLDYTCSLTLKSLQIPSTSDLDVVLSRTGRRILLNHLHATRAPTACVCFSVVKHGKIQYCGMLSKLTQRHTNTHLNMPTGSGSGLVFTQVCSVAEHRALSYPEILGTRKSLRAHSHTPPRRQISGRVCEVCELCYLGLDGFSSASLSAFPLLGYS